MDLTIKKWHDIRSGTEKLEVFIHCTGWCVGSDKDSFITLDRDLLKRAKFFDNLSPLFKFELL